MKFYTHIFVIIVIFLRDIVADSNSDLILDAGLETVTPLSVGLIFFVKINNTSPESDYAVEITPDECCLNDDDNVDCDYLNILGGCYDFIPKGRTKILRVVAPILDVYDRNGHCDIFVDSKSNNSPNKRDALKINFDTTIDNNEFTFNQNLKHCENRDEDPFNDCKPVNCETYYNGKRSYFSRKYKRCVEIPPCVSDDESEYPTVIYNPISNQCDETVNERDLEVVKNLRRKGNNRKVKDVLIISKFEPNVTEFVNTVDLIDNVITITTSKPIKHRVYPIKHISNCGFKSFWEKYFIDNKFTLIIFSSVVTIQCFLICTMFYCLSKTCNCFEDKKVVRKFFNYRQDVSVTTPLIGTSNIDTETDYQYMSETSNNVEQKIKCYKACQKENKNLKASMSDDILSKCLNRRDWKKFKSEAITDVDKDVERKPLDNLNVKDNDRQKTEKIGKLNENKVAFEDEIKNVDRNRTKTVSIVNNAEVMQAENSEIEINNVSSEKEIKCHNYNCFDVSEVKEARNKCNYKVDRSKIGTTSVSTEKGAQIYFSNDSIDDFLSERGVTYLAGENISKYTFSSDFNDVKAASTVSSKTSKNFVKNVLSLLRKKSKLGTSSDPGPNDETDVKLIHMSKASVYTSSNDSDYIRTLKRNDSRTSF